MKNCYCAFCIYLFLIILHLGWLEFCLAQNELLRLEIKLNKYDYVKGEPVFVSINLFNESDNEIVTNRLSVDLGYLKLELKNKSGEIMDNTNRTYQGTPMTLKLLPKSDESIFYNLNLLFGSGDWRLFSLGKLLDHGNYRLQSVFETGFGSIYSNRVEFKVFEPTSGEQEPYLLLKDAEKFELKKDYSKALELLDSLKLKYPQSVYVPMAYISQTNILSYRVRDEKQAVNIARSLIDVYPNTEYALTGLNHILSHVARVGKDEKLRYEILEYVSKKYSGQKVGKYGKKIFTKEQLNK